MVLLLLLAAPRTAVLFGHSGATWPNSAASGAKMVATSLLVVQKPAMSAVVSPEGMELQKRVRVQERVGLPVTPSAGLHEPALPLVSQRAVAGEHLLQTPNILEGISPNGEVRRALPLLGPAEELELIKQARIYVAVADAKRELRVAADRADRAFVFNHKEPLQHMRHVPATAMSRNGVVSIGDNAGVGLSAQYAAQLPDATSDTEFRLVEALGRGAYNKLFLHNQGLIYNEVHQLFPNWRTATVMEKADLLQEGAQGLLRAIRLFDPNRAVRFSTYACWHIRSYILRAVRDKLHVVRLPQTLQRDMSDIRKARYRYAVENQGHSPSHDDLAGLLQWPTKRVEMAIDGLARESTVSLDAAATARAYDESRGALHHRVPSQRHGGAASENAVYQQQLKDTLSKAMAKRDPRRVKLLRLRYGLEDGQEWSYPELGLRFNVTANAAKGMVHQELNFLRRQRAQVLKQFVES